MTPVQTTVRVLHRRVLLAIVLATAIACLCSDVSAQTHKPKTYSIVLEGMRFQPETLTVHRGDRIIWTNRDLVPHTVTAAGAFDSDTIEPQRSWSYTASSAGTLTYICRFHPTMKATLQVQ